MPFGLRSSVPSESSLLRGRPSCCDLQKHTRETQTKEVLKRVFSLLKYYIKPNAHINIIYQQTYFAKQYAQVRRTKAILIAKSESRLEAIVSTFRPFEREANRAKGRIIPFVLYRASRVSTHHDMRMLAHRAYRAYLRFARFRA